MNRFKGFLGTAQAIFLVIIIAIAAWQYFLKDWFFADDPEPSASVSHQLFSACLNSDVRWLRAHAILSNTGLAEINLNKMVHRVARVAPANNSNSALEVSKPQTKGVSTYEWPVISTLEGNAGEKLAPNAVLAENIDFFIAPDIQVVEVTSIYTGDSEKRPSWDLVTVYDIGDSDCS
ncbi:MAG: hypothetical protein HKN59_02105 [Gammaproteobacteria bacterium]|nr:hypothetical protein [Gammaproteobacteria bacterium]